MISSNPPMGLMMRFHLLVPLKLTTLVPQQHRNELKKTRSRPDSYQQKFRELVTVFGHFRLGRGCILLFETKHCNQNTTKKLNSHQLTNQILLVCYWLK